jgi:hypothetical protein
VVVSLMTLMGIHLMRRHRTNAACSDMAIKSGFSEERKDFISSFRWSFPWSQLAASFVISAASIPRALVVNLIGSALHNAVW